MTRRLFRFLALSLFVFGLTTASIQAQSTEFTYQGRLLSGDLPANGSHDFEFSLWDGDSGGNQIGTTITLTQVNVNNGVFSVRIDFGNVFPGANRFLEIKVRQSAGGEFSTLLPRQAITSAPYSIKSLNAETATNSTNSMNAAQLGGVLANQYVLRADPRMSDARDPLPNSPNYIRNTNAPQNADFNITGFGTVGGPLTAFRVAATQQFNIGSDRILSTAGISNLFAGVGAGLNNSGGNNSFFGRSSGESNVAGQFNSFFGSNAGRSNSPAATTGGGNNSFFGAFSGFSNTSGNANSFFGVDAGRSNTLGSDNSFFGRNTGIANTSGTNNSLFGSNANSADGLTNATAIGFRAYVGQSNSLVLGGISNVNAGSDTKIGIGTAAPTAKLTVAGSGAFNAFGAARFDLFNTTANAGFLQHVTDTGLWQLATTVGTTRMVVDSSGNVGIGTTTPSSLFHVRANNGNVLFGHAGCSAGLVGLGFGASLSGCNNYSLLGNGTDTVVSRPAGGTLFFREGNTTQMSIAPGGALTIAGDVTVNRPTGGTVMGVTNGLVDINGTLDVSNLIRVGNLDSGGSAALCRNVDKSISNCSSSIRYKTNIHSFNLGLNLIKRLRPVSFNWKSDRSLDLGLVAEEVAEVAPLLISKNDRGEIEGVKYDRVGVVLVNAVNEQQRQIESQKTKIESQQEQIYEQAQTIKWQQGEIDGLKRFLCSQNAAAEFCRPKN